MSFLKTIGAEVRDWEMDSNPPVDSFGYRDLVSCDYRLFYKVVESEKSMNCEKCIFKSDNLCAQAPLCYAGARKDRRNVYFKAIDIKPLDELL